MVVFPDIATLLLLGSLGAFSVAFIMAIIWLADRSQRHVVFWVFSYFLYGVASLLLALRGIIPDSLSVVAAWPVYFLALASTWYSFRRFADRGQPYDGLIVWLGAAIWFAFTMTGPLFDDMNNRVILQSLVVAAYSIGTAYEIWALFRSEPLPSAPVFMFLYATHGFVQFIRGLAVIANPPPVPSTTDLIHSPLMVAVAIESVLVILLTGMAQMTMMGQRKERSYRIAAQTDEMTGICNRRFFLEQAVPAVTASRGEGALIVLDLDHFKTINDTYGHAAGDIVLLAVTSTISRYIASPNIFGRVGGEEFAVYLPEADGPAAIAFAERLRHSVGGMRINYRDCLLKITVSCGVATVYDAECHYDRLHRNADTALYDAKEAGRNRVVAHVDTGQLWRDLKAATASADGPAPSASALQRQMEPSRHSRGLSC